MSSIFGADCAVCAMKNDCRGCAESCGMPFGEKCMLAALCEKGGSIDALKQELIAEFNALDIEGMDEVSELFALRGAFINMEFTLPNGDKAKFWNDNRIYLGSQLQKQNSDRCYGIAADETHLLVCEYGQGGSDAQLVLFKRR